LIFSSEGTQPSKFSIACGSERRLSALKAESLATHLFIESNLAFCKVEKELLHFGLLGVLENLMLFEDLIIERLQSFMGLSNGIL
jgi:hypothetical protein